jgi:hypothetical protein
METKLLGDCTLPYLSNTFGLERQETSIVLDNWLSYEIELTEREKDNLQFFQHLLSFNIFSWNEQELSMNFIGPLFSLVDFSSKKYNLFAQRTLSGEVQGVLLSGKPDGMIASGFWEPKEPFFAFQEYKKENDPTMDIANGDPAAQALAAMLVGQELNQYTHPVYGCYVVGQNWYFMVLSGKEYSISPSYSALTNEIYDIFKTLKALKQIVIGWAN